METRSVSAAKPKKRNERGESQYSARAPTDTMLRLNIRCLNNQARFDSRGGTGTARGDEREKDREGKDEGIRRVRGENETDKTLAHICVRVRAREKDTRERDSVGDELERERE